MVDTKRIETTMKKKGGKKKMMYEMLLKIMLFILQPIQFQKQISNVIQTRSRLISEIPI